MPGLAQVQETNISLQGAPGSFGACEAAVHNGRLLREVGWSDLLSDAAKNEELLGRTLPMRSASEGMAAAVIGCSPP